MKSHFHINPLQVSFDHFEFSTIRFLHIVNLLAPRFLITFQLISQFTHFIIQLIAVIRCSKSSTYQVTPPVPSSNNLAFKCRLAVPGFTFQVHLFVSVRLDRYNCCGLFPNSRNIDQDQSAIVGARNVKFRIFPLPPPPLVKMCLVG